MMQKNRTLIRECLAPIEPGTPIHATLSEGRGYCSSPEYRGCDTCRKLADPARTTEDAREEVREQDILGRVLIDLWTKYKG